VLYNASLPLVLEIKWTNANNTKLKCSGLSMMFDFDLEVGLHLNRVHCHSSWLISNFLCTNVL